MVFVYNGVHLTLFLVEFVFYSCIIAVVLVVYLATSIVGVLKLKMKKKQLNDY